MNEFRAAVVDHLTWKIMFEEAVRKAGVGLEVDGVAADNHCPLGRWLHQRAPRPVSNPIALQMLLEVHAEFHRSAASVLALAHAGRVRDAVSAMSPDDHYGTWSSTLVTALQRYADAAVGENLG